MIGPSTARAVLEGWGAGIRALEASERGGQLIFAELDGCRACIDEQPMSDGAVAALTIDHLGAFAGHAGAGHTGADFNLLWFSTSGAGAEGHARQIIDALYGAARSFDKRSKCMKPCYFFGESFFSRAVQRLDGAMVVCARDDAITFSLCLNTYSPRWQLLRDAPFARQAHVRVKNPQAEEARDAAYLVDPGTRRGDAAAMLRYVEDKYELERAMNMDSNVASAAIDLRAGSS